MGKKTDRGEPKKECPSCGLGVSLEANICEFCGWDFTEEDEWILQIEKLERDLMLEKQRFEPGTVGHRIEATLRNPIQEKAASEQSSPAEPEPEERAAAEVVRPAQYLIERETPAPARQPETPVQRPAPEPAPWQERVAQAEQAPATPKIRKVRNVREQPQVSPPSPAPEPEPVLEPAVDRRAEPAGMPIRRVRQPEPAPEPPQAQPAQRKVRTVRKVKG